MLSEENAQVIDFSGSSLARFTENFEVATRRWELIVYPSLLAFLILASYGFFLIYSLTHNVHQMRIDMHQYLSSMSQEMDSMSSSVHTMANQFSHMAKSVDQISNTTKIMEPLTQNMAAIKNAIQQVSLSVTYMRNDVGMMSTSIVRSLEPFERMMP